MTIKRIFIFLRFFYTFFIFQKKKKINQRVDVGESRGIAAGLSKTLFE